MSETAFRCPSCSRNSDQAIAGICALCLSRIVQQLAEIVRMANEAHEHIAPERTGEPGRSAYGSRPPINLGCADYAQRLGYTEHTSSDSGHIELFRNGLGMLHEWERLIREERHLTPPALVPYAGSDFAEIVNVCTFLTTHATWATAQSWADELALEVSAIHRAGLVVLRTAPTRRGRIACPGDDPETGELCGNPIWMPEEFSDYITQPGEHTPKKTLWCRNCTTTWTVERLMRVAVEVHGVTRLARGFGKEVTARMLGLSETQLRRRITAERKVG